jgi:hypothetical protein
MSALFLLNIPTTIRFENGPLLSYAAEYSASWQHHGHGGSYNFFFPFGFGILGWEVSTAFHQQNQSVFDHVSQLFREEDDIFLSTS